jgi:hypothetical protein
MLEVFDRVKIDMKYEGPIELLPDVFVYIVDNKDKCYSFIRLSRSADDKTNDRKDPYFDMSEKPQYNDTRYKDVKLDIDQSSYPEGKYYESGYMNIRVAVQSEADWNQRKVFNFGNGSQGLTWSQHPQQEKAQCMNVKVIPNLYMGKNLISADDDGLCDPMVTFYHLDQSANSATFMDSLNPVWNDRFMLSSKAYANWIPPIIVKVLDKDARFLLKDKYECLGLCQVNLTNEDYIRSQDFTVIPEFKLYKVKDETSLDTASLLMSFTVIQMDSVLNTQRLMKFEPQSERYLLKLHILGLRNLQSPGMFSVKNPYIKFHTGALKGSGVSKGGSAYDILTAKCNKGGPNASFSELLT